MKPYTLSWLLFGGFGIGLESGETCTSKLWERMLHGMTMPPVPVMPDHIPVGCSDFEVLFARGGSEPNAPSNGKYGMMVGDPLFGNVSALLRGVTGYPVQYPASSSLTDVPIGRDDIIKRIRKQTAECPNQRFALVGVSIGALVIHEAAAAMPAELSPKVLAIVVYGSPAMACPEDYGKISNELSGRLQESCSKGDYTCDKSGQCHDRHMDYVKVPWIERGAKFIVAAFKGTPMAADVGRAIMLESADIAIQQCNDMMHG